MLRKLATAAVALALSAPGVARAQACCVGASGLTPGWLGNHEKALVGAQLRLAETHGTYPSSGSFFARQPGRDARVEPTFYGSYRVLPRAQVSFTVPLSFVRRRAEGVVESRANVGDLGLVGRYDLVRAGESTIPGLAILAGVQAPTGTPSDRGTGLLAADVSGTGSWEGNAGLSVEQTFGHVVLHATALVGVRTPREVLGLEQQLGLRSLYLLGAGWVWDDDTSMLLTLTHTADGAVTIDGEKADGTGFRVTQAAFVLTTPITDTLRLRTSLFTDIPPLGANRQTLGGTTLGLAKTWL